MSSKYIDALGASKILGLTRQWVTILINRGEVPAEKVGNQWLIDRADLEVYRLRRETNPTPQEADHLKRKAKKARKE